MVGLSIKPSELAGVIEEVRGLYERFTRFPGEGFEGSEETLDHETGDGVRLVGKIDAIFRDDIGGHRLVDWKTGDLGDAEDQLFFYALLWAIVREEMPASVEAISVKTGDIYKTKPSTDDVETVAGEVSRLVSDVRRAWAEGTGLERHGAPGAAIARFSKDAKRDKLRRRCSGEQRLLYAGLSSSSNRSRRNSHRTLRCEASSSLLGHIDGLRYIDSCRYIDTCQCIRYPDVVDFCCTPLSQGAIDETEAADMAPVLAALADPVRLRIVSMLIAAPEARACGCDMEEPLGLSQPTISHHLKVLREAGLVSGEKVGRWVFYQVVPERLAEVSRALSPSFSSVG